MRQRGIQEAFTLARSLNQELEERVRARTADLERALDDLRSTTAQISEHERIEAMKDDFIAMVSHELRTPLTSIHVSLALIVMLMGEELSPRARELTDIACRNSQRLVRLIDSVLDIAKIEAGKLEFEFRQVDLVPLLEQAIKANESYGSQFGVRFRLETELSDVRVNVDPDRLIQVMTNLLSNAAKFSTPDEVVTVRVERRSRELRVAIHDHGPGISEELRGRIFQKFARAGAPDVRDPGGSGLGLSISKSIIEAMGGRIGFESAPNRGSTFYFDLPDVSELGASVA
jgi:signal transduction histidine kinase